jgi:hypothetical protein
VEADGHCDYFWAALFNNAHSGCRPGSLLDVPQSEVQRIQILAINMLVN